MRIDNAFRAPGRTRGVTHRTRIVLIHFRVVEVAGRGSEERLVVIHAAGNRFAVQRHNDHALEIDLVTKLRQQGKQHIVNDQEPVPGVIGDIGDVLRREAQIERVQDAARSDHAEIGFKVGVMVPHQGRHAITRLETGARQRFGQKARAPVKIGIGVTMQ